MSRRLGVLLLVAFVSLSGLATCRRVLMACPMARQGAHDCCKHRTTLRADDCCCRVAGREPAAAISTAPQSKGVPVTLVAAPLHAAPAPAADGSSLLGGQHSHSQGPAPPVTPITQHTLLLL